MSPWYYRRLPITGSGLTRLPNSLQIHAWKLPLEQQNCLPMTALISSMIYVTTCAYIFRQSCSSDGIAMKRYIILWMRRTPNQKNTFSWQLSSVVKHQRSHVTSIRPYLWTNYSSTRPHRHTYSSLCTAEIGYWQRQTHDRGSIHLFFTLVNSVVSAISGSDQK
jgi:hypothetical protein